mgnify:CR=1 FL=1
MILKERIRLIFSDIFESKTFDLAVLKKHFSPQYRQHVDGQTLDFEAFTSHIKTLKEAVQSTKIHFEHILEEGPCVSTVHHVDAVKKDGSIVKADVFAYFEFENDQCVLCKELTRITEGSKEDADLGSRH